MSKILQSNRRQRRRRRTFTAAEKSLLNWDSEINLFDAFQVKPKRRGETKINLVQITMTKAIYFCDSCCRVSSVSTRVVANLFDVGRHQQKVNLSSELWFEVYLPRSRSRRCLSFRFDAILSDSNRFIASIKQKTNIFLTDNCGFLFAGLFYRIIFR